MIILKTHGFLTKFPHLTDVYPLEVLQCSVPLPCSVLSPLCLLWELKLGCGGFITRGDQKMLNQDYLMAATSLLLNI